MPITTGYVGPGADMFPVLPSAARTADPNSMEFEDLAKAVGVIIVVDVTAIVTAPSITVKLQGVDLISGKTWDIITSAAITAVGTTVLRVRPGITTIANVAVADVLPPVMRVTVTHGNANSITYSVAGYIDRS
jgi:hypothetical protein